MAGPADPSAHASPLFLREEEVRRGIELLIFGSAQLARTNDPRLTERGLGRAHARAVYFIGRRPGLSVGALRRLLGVTKQSLGRVLGDLTEHALIEAQSGEEDRRQRHLRLTVEGAALEGELFEAMRAQVAAAYGAAGQQAVSGFWQVLGGLVSVEDRALLLDLGRGR